LGNNGHFARVLTKSTKVRRTQRRGKREKRGFLSEGYAWALGLVMGYKYQVSV